jgi:hypothetical protein
MFGEKKADHFMAVSQQADEQTVSQYHHSGAQRNHANRPPGRIAIWYFHH